MQSKIVLVLCQCQRSVSAIDSPGKILDFLGRAMLKDFFYWSSERTLHFPENNAVERGRQEEEYNWSVTNLLSSERNKARHDDCAIVPEKRELKMW